MIRSVSAAVGEISPLIIVLLALSLMATTLNADTLITYNFQNTTFSLGGMLTGSFVYDATTGLITEFDLLTSPDGFLFPFDLHWETPTIGSPGDNHKLTADIGSATLFVDFQDLNSAHGHAEVNGGSITALDLGQSDFITNGSVNAVPEPDTLPILLFGTLGLIGVTQRRRILRAAKG